MLVGQRDSQTSATLSCTTILLPFYLSQLSKKCTGCMGCMKLIHLFGVLMFVLTFPQKINWKLYQESDSKCLFWARESGRPVSNVLITTIIQLVSKIIVSFNVMK